MTLDSTPVVTAIRQAVGLDSSPAAAAPAAVSPQRERHFPGLDTLRACAILMVIPSHARDVLGGAFFGPLLKSIFLQGWIGVDLFFVLSGFLIGAQVLQGQKHEGRVRFGRFYLKRSLRILPSYYAVLLLYYVWPAFREKPDIDPAWRFLLYIMNYGRKYEAFSHAWSLCVEEHFYLVFPLMVAVCAWRPKIFRPGVIIGGLLIGVVALRYYLWSTGAPFYPAVYRPSHTHLDGLTIGVALALLKESRGDIWAKLTAWPWTFFLGGIFLVGCGVYTGMPAALHYVLTFTFVSFGFGALVVAAMAPGFWLARVRIPGAATTATLAFTLYLTHKQMLHLTTLIIDDYKDHTAATVALALGLIAVASCSLHYGVERPFLKLRDRILSRGAPTRHPHADAA